MLRLRLRPRRLGLKWWRSRLRLRPRPPRAAGVGDALRPSEPPLRRGGGGGVRRGVRAAAHRLLEPARRHAGPPGRQGRAERAAALGLLAGAPQAGAHRRRHGRRREGGRAGRRHGEARPRGADAGGDAAQGARRRRLRPGAPRAHEGGQGAPRGLHLRTRRLRPGRGGGRAGRVGKLNVMMWGGGEGRREDARTCRENCVCGCG